MSEFIKKFAFQLAVFVVGSLIVAGLVAMWKGVANG